MQDPRGSRSANCNGHHSGNRNGRSRGRARERNPGSSPLAPALLAGRKDKGGKRPNEVAGGGLNGLPILHKGDRGGKSLSGVSGAPPHPFGTPRMDSESRTRSSRSMPILRCGARKAS